METSASMRFAPPRMPWRYPIRSSGCVPLSLLVCVVLMRGRKTWLALSRREMPGLDFLTEAAHRVG